MEEDEEGGEHLERVEGGTKHRGREGGDYEDLWSWEAIISWMMGNVS